MVAVPRVNNEETMMWLERSLELVGGRTQEKLTGLLEAVQLEVAFELAGQAGRGHVKGRRAHATTHALTPPMRRSCSQ
jgi:hypothetical protein